MSPTRLLTSLDLHLFGEGTHQRIYQKLGAHLAEVDGASGLHFAVWAPNADRVSVVGDFNAWNGLAHPMRPVASSGIWAVFVPGIGNARSS
jgi:1,4-alpha-glucan branching enzyme